MGILSVSNGLLLEGVVDVVVLIIEWFVAWDLLPGLSRDATSEPSEKAAYGTVEPIKPSIKPLAWLLESYELFVAVDEPHSK